LSLDRAFRWTGLVGVALFFATAFTPLAHALNANRLAVGHLERCAAGGLLLEERGNLG
jgi:hypothetical protein